MTSELPQSVREDRRDEIIKEWRMLKLEITNDDALEDAEMAQAFANAREKYAAQLLAVGYVVRDDILNTVVDAQAGE